MPAIGMGLAWIGYTVGLWGYCLVKGYDVTIVQLANPVKPYAWPKGGPAPIPDSQLLPGPAAALTSRTKKAGGGGGVTAV
jgi:hypothetical protein